ncbi:N-acetylmuramidase domain-containing protein [Rhizobium tumorigenes]|uniref:N-acetylmuramidase domain-containing protein n=1 Tax=Rhizobium tumorigenes TaxID=2041385 RepID=UPI00241CDD0A|nr:N-acetylmuramidase domain-containing protein [Rhizobium tumorigenes]WFS02223.1 N-acetylmuramidase domain-containing protein [Rhizobium tumorigenes]
MFDISVISAITSIAVARKIAPAALCAVVDTESNGVTSTRISGVDMPLIRIEGHYFDKLVPAAKQAAARKAALASPVVGGVKNPDSQEARYRMFTSMCDIDRDAAISSCSWGVGQVMGVHWKALGFATAEAFRAYVCATVSSQVEVMVRFIETNGLLDEIERQDWAGFARGYNGAGYRKNNYDVKLAKAFDVYGGVAGVSSASGMLRMGSSGAGVRELQALLVRFGCVVKVDGDFGPSTRDALQAFQKMKGLTVDGLAGPETQAALKAYQVTPSEKPGALPVSQIPSVQKAAKAMAPVALVTTMRGQITDVAAQLSGAGTHYTDVISSSLLAGAAAIGVGLTCYGLYGWWRSTKTVEQG